MSCRQKLMTLKPCVEVYLEGDKEADFKCKGEQAALPLTSASVIGPWLTDMLPTLDVLPLELLLHPSKPVCKSQLCLGCTRCPALKSACAC